MSRKDPETMTYEEVFDLVDMLVSTRYGDEGVDFLAAFSEGTAEERYPGCEDIMELAEFLEQ